jgi:phosphonatase-like hydrolase
MSIELVVFDMTGTTVADGGNINDFFRKAFSNAGMRGVAAGDIDRVRGYRKKEAIEIIAEKYNPPCKNDENFIENIHRDFTNQVIEYYETCEGLSALPFAEKVFLELQNNKIKVALNTGFTRVIAAPVLKRLGWDTASFIDAIICSDEVPEGRPHPYMIEQLMQKLNISYPENVAKVGDTLVDIKEGQNAGCGIVVAVTTGAYTREQLIKYHPDHIIDSLQLLPSLIL